MIFVLFDGGGDGTLPFEQVQFTQMQTYFWGGEGGLGIRVDGEGGGRGDGVRGVGDGLWEGGGDVSGGGRIGLGASRTLLM